MKKLWDRRIARAQELSTIHASAAELLTTYSRLASFQKRIFDDLLARPQTDPIAVAAYWPQLTLVAPPAVVDYPHAGFEGGIDALLAAHWNHEPADDPRARFVARALLQPFAEALAQRGAPPSDASSPTCPFCGARPLASVLRGEGEGGKRFLACSLCSNEWEYRRILCPNCGETNQEKLPVFTTPDFDYIRIEACDACGAYLKSIDMTRNGLAVTPADELASVALNVWAEEHGYAKIEPNILGL
jgi:FdhE protein